MKLTLTDITIILDRSGSMAIVANDTIGGFNRFIDDQKKTPGEARITLNQFDHEFERVMDAADIQNASHLTHETFVPRGNTALLDAIGRSIIETGKRLSSIPENDRPAKVVVVIITDGQENASREFTRAKIDEMISEQQKKYQWQFVFLGANQDAIATAASIGINRNAAMTYAANPHGTQESYRSLSRNMSAMRCSVDAHATVTFSEDDRKKQQAAGATH